jgi:large subunit ribosomal protein L9e
MIRGVTDGFKFRMRMAYNHFPIKCLVNKTGSQISIDSFLGEKRIRIIDALPNTKIIKNEEEKDTIYV